MLQRSCCRSMTLSTSFKCSPMRVPLRRCNSSATRPRHSGRAAGVSRLVLHALVFFCAWKISSQSARATRTPSRIASGFSPRARERQPGRLRCAGSWGFPRHAACQLTDSCSPPKGPAPGQRRPLVVLVAWRRWRRCAGPRRRGGTGGLPSQQHPPIMIVGPTVTMAWPPMGVPAAASSVSSETSQKKSSSVWSSSAVRWFTRLPLFAC